VSLADAPGDTPIALAVLAPDDDSRPRPSLAGMLARPQQTFAALRLAPQWTPALAFSSIAMVAMTAVTLGRTDLTDLAALNQARINGGRVPLSPEEIDTVLRMQPIVWWGAVAAGCVLPCLTAAAIAGVFRPILARWDARITFRQVFAITAYGMMPKAVATYLALFAVLVGTGAPAAAGRAIRGYAAPIVHAGGALTPGHGASAIFTLWTIFLLGTGYGMLARRAPSAGIGLVFATWIMYLGVTMALRTWMRS
jgi:hypothetical protein